MTKKFRTNVHYAMVFDNVKDFDIWGNWGPIARANYNMGWHSSAGYSEQISLSENAWRWAAVNNAAYEYYQYCERVGIALPPDNLKIWTFRSTGNSAAPMLRRINDVIAFNRQSDWINFLANSLSGVPATVLNQMLRFLLPDVVIGTKTESYRVIYNSVYHELSHASHFSQVGSQYWARYVSYIMSYGAYGDGTGKNAELCAIGEMWGYSHAAYNTWSKYNPEKSIIFENYPGSSVGAGAKEWIHPQVFWDLYKMPNLFPRNLFRCLTAEIDTYDKLIAKLYEQYPLSARNIKSEFQKYGIESNVPLPPEWNNDIDLKPEEGGNVRIP